MLLLEQNHCEEAGIQKPYKIDKNAIRYINTLLLCYLQECYKNMTQLEFKASNNEEYEVDSILGADQYFFLIV